MFRSKEFPNLLFDFKKKNLYAIHSFFVFFPFLALWLDEQNQVIDWKIVSSWVPYVAPKSPYVKLVEIPCNKKNDSIIRLFTKKNF